MATRKTSRPAAPQPATRAQADTSGTQVSSSIDELMLAALARNDGSLQTGRFLVTFKPEAMEAGLASMRAQSLRVADARDFSDQAVNTESAGDADALVFPEIGVALLSGAAAQERGMTESAEAASDSPVEVIEPEYFVFSSGEVDDYLRGFLRAAETIAKDLGKVGGGTPADEGLDALVLGNTWGLVKCKVPPSVRSGAGIRLAVLDTGFDLGHPDFAGRIIVSQTFVGQPVQDLHGHGTHTVGTACGPKAPSGLRPRYGIGYGTQIYVGKVLSNSGSGSSASVLGGMNWAIANNCAVISMSLGSQSPVQAAYTAAGQQALAKGCLIIAAAGNAGAATGSPANSPTIMSVASLDPNLAPSSFSNFGKVEIAAPGRDVYSAAPRPQLNATMSGTSMATPHVAGCAALWAQTSPGLRGQALWNMLQARALALPYPAARVGRGLVQAP